MMSKRADLILSPGIEKHVLPAYDAAWGPSYLPIHSRVFEKTASEVYIPDRLIKAAASLRPREDGRYVHINAVGANEAWGSNRNGDLFWEWSLLGETPPPHVQAFLKRRGLRPPPEYGISTFETYAYPFVLHNNKDPKFSIGEKVICAAYNEKMKRGELIVFIRKDDPKDGVGLSAPDLIDMIDRGDPIPWSMGCFPAGTPIAMADGTSKPIEEVKIGDLVLTHTGAVKRVTELHPRPYEGLLLDFEVEGGNDLSVTGNHPFWAATRDMALKNGRWVDDPETDFLHAECLKEGDYLTTPVMNEVLTPDYATPALAQLFGYYLAKGHVLRNKKGAYAGIEFTANKDDAIVDEIEDIARTFGTRNPPVIRPRTNSEHAVRIDIFDSHLAEMCYDHCGSYGRGKRLSEDVMQWHPDLQKHLLGKYLNGDGHQMTSWRKGAAIISTASDYLADQVPHMLARVGIPSTVHLLRHEAGGGFNESVTFEHQIYIGKQYVNILAEFSKIEPVECRPAGSGARLIGGHIFRRIKGIQERFFQGFVYNFEVEDDESYVAAGYGVHNCKVNFDICSICKNAAKNRSQYCDHLRTLLNVTLPDGRKVAAENWFPRFFDISRVITPAFAPAYSLRKVAGVSLPVADPAVVHRHDDFTLRSVDFVKVASAQESMRRKRTIFKLGTMTKNVPAEPGQDNLGKTILKPKVEKILSRLVRMDDKDSSFIPSSTMKKIRETTSPEEIINGATSAGILLKKPEVESITGGDPDKVPDRLDLDSVLPRLLSKLKDLIPSRSLFDPPFAKRVVRIIRISEPGPESEDIFGKEASEAYDKYLVTLGKLDIEDLVKAASRTLLIRDPSAVENAFVGVKTASDRFRPVTPFLVGLKLRKV